MHNDIFTKFGEIYKYYIHYFWSFRMILLKREYGNFRDSKEDLLVSYEIFSLAIKLFVLYGCETWSLTLREKCWVRVFANRILRRIFGHTRDEMSREASTMRPFIVSTNHLI